MAREHGNSAGLDLLAKVVRSKQFSELKTRVTKTTVSARAKHLEVLKTMFFLAKCGIIRIL
jgi:hypothetical protein